MADSKKAFALVLGIVLLIVGILGFINNGIVGDTGFFTTNPTQDALHLIAGALGIYAGTKGTGKGYSMILGWIGIVLAVLGFIPGTKDLLLTWLNINTNITVLHLVIGVVCLGVHYMGKKQ